MDRRQYDQGVKLLDHHLGTAVGQAVHRGQHHAEAMEQGHTDAQLVVLGESHILAGEVTIVRDAEVGQHHTLGETRGAAGVLHVADVIATHVFLHLVQSLVFDILAQEQQLGGVVHAAIFLHADIDDVLQIGETLTVQITAFAGLQLGQHGVGHIYIVTVPCAVGDTQHFHIGVLTQILQFVLLVVGVHRHQHGANLGGGIEKGEPVGHVGGPDAHIRAFLHANGYQTLGQVVHTLVELLPREA